MRFCEPSIATLGQAIPLFFRRGTSDYLISTLKWVHARGSDTLSTTTVAVSQYLYSPPTSATTFRMVMKRIT